MTTLPSSFWHKRFTQQAHWTQNLRHYVYGLVNLAHADRVLEVGCGTGVILTELIMQSHGGIYGLDISTEHLDMAAINLPGIPLALGDAHVLPYSAGVFDISICHFLLLWVTDPVRVVSELARTTKPGGFVLALAEPDYGGRIDYPPELSILGNWQQAALTRQGADPLLGRRLRAIFTQAGLTNVVAGLLGGQWSGKPSLDAWNMEWEVLQDDIHNTTQNNQTKELTRLHTIDEQAWEQGERVLFVPTFYAYGQLP